MSGPGPGRPVLIGVDGRSGAGKTVLADALAARLAPFARVAVLRIESMYPGWDGLAAAVDEGGPYPAALRALHADGTAAWRAWDWHRGAPGEPTAIGPADVVVCEGVGALSVAACPLLDLAVWLELETPTRRSRALARDGETYAPHWERWAAHEEAYLARHDPRSAADLVVRLPSA